MEVKKKNIWKSMMITTCCSCSSSNQISDRSSSSSSSSHRRGSEKKKKKQTGATSTAAATASASASFHRLSLSEFNIQRVSVSDVSNPGGGSLSEDISNSLVGSNLHVFTLAELKAITQNFSSANFLGEGGFGPVHKGFVDDRLCPGLGLEPQPVAVKLLDSEGLQGHREWLAEVIFLGQLRHPHLVKLLGYSCEDEHRVLVYEYMPRGSLENQLFRRYSVALPWSTRMKIALGAAKGLAFLHEAEKPVIYRDFKASNILLDSDYTPKLSDFGLAKDGPEGDDTHVSTRVMGTHGYAAPEYIMTGHLTARSDVYSFGVVLLELLTGRRSVDKARPQREQNLAEWARPMLSDQRKLTRIMDPRLDGQYSEKGAQKAAALAYNCLSHRPKHRPAMSAVVATLEPLTRFHDVPVDAPFVYTVPQVATECDRKSLKDTNERLPPRVGAEVEAAPSPEVDNGGGGESQQLVSDGGRQRHRCLGTPKSDPTVFSETVVGEKLEKGFSSPLR